MRTVSVGRENIFEKEKIFVSCILTSLCMFHKYIRGVVTNRFSRTLHIQVCDCTSTQE